MKVQNLWLPTRELTLGDSINRFQAATGSVSGAMAASGADYNGHSVDVSFKPYSVHGPRWSATYTWAGIVRLGGGSLSDALRSAVSYYDRGAHGAEVVVNFREAPDPEAAAAEALALEPRLVPYDGNLTRNAHRATWADAERIDELPQARRLAIIGAVRKLMECKTVAEFRAWAGTCAGCGEIKRSSGGEMALVNEAMRLAIVTHRAGESIEVSEKGQCNHG